MSEQWKKIDPAPQSNIGQVQMKVQKYGKWTLGYQWVTVSLGEASTTGLALYAQKKGQKRDLYVSLVSPKEAIDWFTKSGVPSKSIAKVLLEAASTGSWPK